MFQEIIATAPDSEEKNPDLASLEGKVYFLEENKKKYWVKNNKNHFMLFPRGMSITWGNDPRYWAWKKQENGGTDDGIEVAELKDVCWLEVDGKMELSHLTPGVVYQVVFEVKMRKVCGGWSLPVNLRLKFPYGSVDQERKANLDDKPREEWLDLVVGEFKPQKGQRGNLLVSLFQFAGEWKKGLVIRGVRIVPKEP